MSDDMGGTRVSDAERQEVVERLTRAQGEGRLDLAEFEERAGVAWAAVVRRDLAPLTADLPVEVPVSTGVSAGRSTGVSTQGLSTDGGGEQSAAGDARSGLRAAAAAWAVVSAVNLAIWAVVSLAVAGPMYPWWIWVAGPWGAILALHAVLGRGLPGPPRPGHLLPFAPSALPGPCGRGRRHGVHASRATRPAYD